jgi:predicted N-acetyltransferase YhbS
MSAGSGRLSTDSGPLCFDEPMELIEFGMLTTELRTELEGDERDPWDAGRVPPMRWRPKHQHLAVRGEDGKLVASAGLLVVDVEVGGTRFPVVGLGGVIVNAAYRGQGLSLRVIEAALARAATLGPDFVVLFCHADRIGLYTRFGFQDIAAEVLVENGGGQLAMPMHTMWRALRADASWPDGGVELHSSPF